MAAPNSAHTRPSHRAKTAPKIQPSMACGPPAALTISGMVMNGPTPIMSIMFSVVAPASPTPRISSGWSGGLSWAHVPRSAGSRRDGWLQAHRTATGGRRRIRCTGSSPLPYCASNRPPFCGGSPGSFDASSGVKCGSHWSMKYKPRSCTQPSKSRAVIWLG